MVWLPDDRILAAGDLIDAMPFAGHGTPAAWARTLRSLLELDFETIVPGHGPVYRGRERVETLVAYFEDLATQAADAVAAGLTLEQALETVDLTVWRERLADDEEAGVFFDQVRAEAIRAAWVEAGGAAPAQ